MCELFAMSARMPTTVTLSLAEFSRRGGETGPHSDGWGIAYYEEGDVRRIRDTDAASTSPWVRFIEERGLRSTMVLAHIRHATSGSVRLRNTHPFRRELGGTTHVFAHNGTLVGIEKRFHPREWLFHPLGDTDSEIAFCLLLERLAPLWLDSDSPPSIEARAAVFRGFAAEMRELGPSNFIYADGRHLFVHSHRRQRDDGVVAPPGLCMLQRSSPIEDSALRSQSVTVGGEGQAAVLFASVPLSDEAWQPIAEGETAIAAGGRVVAPHSA
jgi:predicted glutamine amidotransferase